MKDEDVVKMVVRDIRKARRLGCDIDMSVVGVDTDANGVYQLESDPCAVCMVGAALLGKKTKFGSVTYDFAQLCGHKQEWGDGFMEGSLEPGLTEDYLKENFTPAWRSGYKLGLKTLAKLEALNLVGEAQHAEDE